MKPPTVVARFTNLKELVLALCQRLDQLNISQDTLDEIAGFTTRYSSKQLCWPQIRKFGNMSFGTMLETLCVKGVLVDDPEARIKLKDRLTKRERAAPIRSAATDDGVAFEVSRRKLALLGRKGGQIRASKMTPKQRSRSARRASRARWRRNKARRPSGKINVPKDAPEWIRNTITVSNADQSQKPA